MFRFSIRELMLVTLVVGLAVGWCLDKRNWCLDKRNSDTEIAVLQAKLVPIEEQMSLIDAAILQKIDAAKEAGELTGCNIGVRVGPDSSVWIFGKVSTEKQQILVLEAARRVQGVAKVINDLTILGP